MTYSKRTRPCNYPTRHELYCIKSIFVTVVMTGIVIVGIIVIIVTLVTVLVNAGTLAASDSR